MYKVERSEPHRVAPLFKDLAEMQLHVGSVFDGVSPGEIYADDREAPSAACVIAGEGHYLAARQPLSRPFAEALNARLPRDSIYALFPDARVGTEDLARVAAHAYAIPARRCYFRLRRQLVPDWEARIPEGFSLQRVDRALLQGELGEGILEEWRSIDAFCAYGFGFCLLHEGQIVSRCMADYVQGQRCEIGVATSWGHRRRGFGTLVVAATVDHALGAGITGIGWHCWANNAGSIGVAENVGFEKVTDYEIWLNHWAAENVSDMSADAFRAFAHEYEQAFAADPPHGGFPHIVTAKAWALCDEDERCYRQLTAAVDAGWPESVEQLREMWPEFFAIQHLDQTTAWQRIAARLR